MSKKHNLEYMKQYWADRGAVLLAVIYKDAHTSMCYRCSNCGQKSWASYSAFKAKNKNGRCRLCGVGALKNSFVEVDKEFRAAGYRIADDEIYQGIHVKIRCYCPNNHPCNKSLGEIRLISKFNGTGCIQCRQESPHWNPSGFLDEEAIKKEYADHGYQMLEAYNGSHRGVKCICPNNHTCFASLVVIRMIDAGKCYSACKTCGIERSSKSKRTTKEELEGYFYEAGCKLRTPYEDYVNYDSILEFDCHCGRVGRCEFSNFQQRRRCAECGREQGRTKQSYTKSSKLFRTSVKRELFGDTKLNEAQNIVVAIEKYEDGEISKDGRKITAANAQQLIYDYMEGILSRKQIAEKYGITEGHVKQIVTGKCFRKLKRPYDGYEITEQRQVRSQFKVGSTGHALITKDQAQQAIYDFINGKTYAEIAKKLGLNNRYVYQLIRGTAWKDLIRPPEVFAIIAKNKKKSRFQKN